MDPAVSIDVKKPNRLFVVLSLTAAAAVVVAGLAVRTHVAAEQAEGLGTEAAPAAAAVRAASVRHVASTMRADFHGFLAPYVKLTVATRVSGEIVQQTVEASDDVTEGQVLFSIDDAVRKLEHEQAQAALAGASSQSELAKAKYDRIASLPEQTSSSIEYIQARLDYSAAKADQECAAARVRQTAVLLERSAVTSPIDGVVSRIFSRAGEFAGVGQPLAAVMEIDRLKVLTELDGPDVVWLRPGQRASLRVEALPGAVFEGTVARVYPGALAGSHKFEVEIELPNPERRLRPGFFVSGVIVVEKKAGTPTEVADPIVVPREAVFDLFGQKCCFVVRALPGDPQDTDVREARRIVVSVQPMSYDLRHYRVVEGLQAGDVVVTKGHQHLGESATVRITN